MTSQKNILQLHESYNAGVPDERIFGGFMEHMGRCVYQGVFEPGHPQADAAGYRLDVLEALKGLRFTAMRYPGGNFASGYHWRDGIGPREKRPKTRELAWQSVESNAFGTEEYLSLVRRMGWSPMLTANLGTGSPEEARDWVEYCNAPAGTRVSDLRGGPPHGVKLWCLGNEMDGPWQLGHVPARDYAIRAQQAGKMMKDCDPGLELVASGSCSTGLPTYMEWDREILEYLGDLADYVSLHRYSANREDDTPHFLAEGLRIERQIQEMDAACRFVQAKRRSGKRAYLCFDEWNVWYKNMEMNGAGKEAPRLIEEVYNLEDALVVAQYLNAFLRHADSVKIANLAQIVNVIAPLLAESRGVLKQSTYHAFAMVSNRRGGSSLTPKLTGPTYDARDLKEVPVLDASALLDGTRLKVFVVNRDGKGEQSLEIRLAGRELRTLERGEVLSGKDPKAANTWDSPAKVAPQPFGDAVFQGGTATVNLPPLSFTALEFHLEKR